MISIPKELIKQTQQGNLLLFIGERILQDAEGQVMFDQLAVQLAERCEQTFADQYTFSQIAQIYQDKKNSHALIYFMREKLEGIDHEPQPIHHLIASLSKCRVLVTTSIDRRLERAFEQAGRPLDVMVGNVDVAFEDQQKAKLYMLRGVIDRPQSLVLTEEEHETFFEDQQNISVALQAELARKTILFLGYDLADPFFQRLYGQVIRGLHKFSRRAYALFEQKPDPLVFSRCQRWNIEVVVADATTFLKALTVKLASHTVPQNLDLSPIFAFEKKYRQQVGNRHKYISPPDFERVRKVPLNDLYVTPDFIPRREKQQDKAKRVPISDFCAQIRRTVLLGDPGSGKSTFASKLCYDLATSYNNLLAGQQVTPIHVILRDYSAAKKDKYCSIRQFIEMTAVSVYQLSSPPEGAFEYLLQNRRVMVIFDGLDELLNTRNRQMISADVESFCTLYPAVPVLVTSRKVGYEQAPLDPQKFKVFYLAPFNEEQVKTYVQKWFALHDNLTAQEQRQQVTAFMAESKVVPDLRSNTLLLALMCNLYRGIGYIPQNRPDVYQKCTEMLFENWDKDRDISYQLPLEEHVKPLMMYLAHWIYADEARQSGIREHKLIGSTTHYFNQWASKNWDEAEHAARALIKFFRGRIWIFTDTGTTKTGDKLYQFTHRTFLEYFTAAHLVRKYRTPDQLVDFLLPKIKEKEWDVVAQLAFHIQSKHSDEASDELLTLLLEQVTDDEHGWNVLSFAVRCLEFMVPSPPITATITHACLNGAVASARAEVARQDSGKYNKAYFHQLLFNLCSSTIENQETIIKNMKKAIARRVNDNNDIEAYILFEVVLNLNILPMFDKNQDLKKAQLLRDVSIQIYKDTFNLLLPLLPKYYTLAVFAWRQGEVPLHDLIEWYGIHGLFRDQYAVVPNYILTCPAERLVIIALLKEIGLFQFVKPPISNLREMGRIALIIHPPWTTSKNYFTIMQVSGVHKKTSKQKTINELLMLDSESLFGLFALIATYLEMDEYPLRLDRTLSYINDQELPIFELLQATFLRRYIMVNKEKVQAELGRCGFNAKQQTFVWRWVHREINLVEPPTEEKKKSEIVKPNIYASQLSSNKS